MKMFSSIYWSKKNSWSTEPKNVEMFQNYNMFHFINKNLQELDFLWILVENKHWGTETTHITPSLKQENSKIILRISSLVIVFPLCIPCPTIFEYTHETTLPFLCWITHIWRVSNVNWGWFPKVLLGINQ